MFSSSNHWKRGKKAACADHSYRHAFGPMPLSKWTRGSSCTFFCEATLKRGLSAGISSQALEAKVKPQEKTCEVALSILVGGVRGWRWNLDRIVRFPMCLDQSPCYSVVTVKWVNRAAGTQGATHSRGGYPAAWRRPWKPGNEWHSFTMGYATHLQNVMRSLS